MPNAWSIKINQNATRQPHRITVIASNTVTR